MDSKKRELMNKDPLVVVHTIYEPLGNRGKGRSAVLIMVMAQKSTEEANQDKPWGSLGVLKGGESTQIGSKWV